MKSVVVIQARTNSSRLPGKVLLPINGLPLVILAARRAANTGKEVVIATSTETTDDALVDMVEEYGFRCYRGSLGNTLQRIVFALDGYDDATLVFRLTADNVFPDGKLLDEVEQDFIKRKLDYLCCNGEPSGLPYGLSTEVTRLGHLRKAVTSTQSAFDKEHVTPYIKRTFGEAYFKKYSELGKGHFRCTIDSLDDYLGIKQVFSKVQDAVQVPALELVRHLEGADFQPIVSNPAKKLVLGTAQLGMNYGIANKSGKPDSETASHLIKTAIANGVSFIDTARAYGDSEEVVGNVLATGWQSRVQVVTKLSPLDACPEDAVPAVVNEFVDASLYRSCSDLRVKKLDVLMLHRASQVRNWNGSAWSRLLQHKANGTVMALGASVQTPGELELVLGLPDISFIQMPCNVLEWRWERLIPEIRAAKQQRDLVIHARSGLLQGLLASTSAEYWKKANVADTEKVIDWLRVQSINAEKDSVANFCLSAVKSFDWIDGVVVGMESLEQLEDNIRIFSGPDISKKTMDAIVGSRPTLGENTLNPACWS